MSTTVDGQSRVPPGFRFHPTDDELLDYYLRKKIACEKIDFDVIREIDLNKLEPWDIQDKCRIGSTPQNDWYFFSHKDKKYPTGTRTNRATTAGFWKATGRDKIIYTGLNRIGMRKTLVFYKGRAPHGQKSNWIIHEYRLDENQDTCINNPQPNECSSIGEVMGQEEGWVVCRVFKKKNYSKALDGPSTSSSSSIFAGGKNPIMSNSAGLDHSLQYIVRSCKHEPNDPNSDSSRKYLTPIEIPNTGNDYMRLPALETVQTNSVNLDNSSDSYHQQTDATLDDWVALDRLVASHLNSQSDDDGGFGTSFYSSTPNRLAINYPQDSNNGAAYDGGSYVDLWGAFTGSEHFCPTS